MRFTEEQRQFRLAPPPFAPEATTFATVSPRALVRLEGAVYSVPSRWAGLDLVVRIGATTVTIVGREGTRILHPRKRFGQRSIDYRHYLSELARKPQAVRQVLPDFRGIWVSCFRRFGISSTWRMGRVTPRGCSPRSRVARSARRGDCRAGMAAALAAGTPLLLALTPTRSPALGPAGGGADSTPGHRGGERTCRRLRRLAPGGRGMSATLTRELVVAQTRALKLPGVARAFDGVARQARDAHWPHEDDLHEVLSAEQASRHDRASATDPRGAVSRVRDPRHV